MHIKTELNVNASADRAWQVIGEQFGEFAHWSSALDATKLIGKLEVGGVRACRSRSIGPFPAANVTEKLVEFNPEKRRYKYIVTSGLPSIFKSAQNTWTIEETSVTSCIVRTHIETKLKVWMRPLGWLFPILMKRDLKTLFGEMVYFIEKGEVHPRKLQSQLELSSL